MSDIYLDNAIMRLTNWIDNYGAQKEPWFLRDLMQVIAAAQSFRNRKPVDEILLSDEFLKKFAAAFKDVAFASSVVSLGPQTDLFTMSSPVITVDPDLQTPPDTT